MNIGSRVLRCLPAIAIAVLVSCSQKKIRASVHPRAGESRTGVASWYGDPYHGRKTASGETYDMERMTAAHREWAFGTMVRVRVVDSGKSVDVRINDRGPFVRGRVIDLSRAAAREAGMLNAGIAKVKLTVISAPPPPPPRGPAKRKRRRRAAPPRRLGLTRRRVNRPFS